MKSTRKVKKTIVSTLLLVLILALGLTACSSTPSSGGADKLVIAVDDTYPPMEFRDENNNLVGFDIDLAKAIGEKLGVEVEFVSTAWDGIFEGLKSDMYDAIISSVSMTTDRLEEFDFTKPYLANGQVIVVNPGDTSITTPEDLAGKRVGVQLSTTADEAAEKHLETIDFELSKYDDIMQTFTAMEAGRLDAIVVDAAVAIDYVSKSPEKFEISSAQLTNEPIAVCLKKGNTELRDRIQGAIDELAQDGTLKEISVEWLGDDYTSDIDENLY